MLPGTFTTSFIIRIEMRRLGQHRPGVHQLGMLCSNPDVKVFNHTPDQAPFPREASQPIGLSFGRVRTVSVDGCEHGADKHAVSHQMVLCPNQELLSDLDVGGGEVRGLDLR